MSSTRPTILRSPGRVGCLINKSLVAYEPSDLFETTSFGHPALQTSSYAPSSRGPSRLQKGAKAELIRLYCHSWCFGERTSIKNVFA